ncbi:MAG: flagellar type III secretion system pore protein FliP [Clostridiales bacterium]|nr:flagellar type III secretion system pore protein FliP [Clostridiales bacterium]
MALDSESVASTLQVFIMLTLIGLAPYLLVMFTSFTRIIISLSFLRSAMGTQQMPPNQILIGVSLFLTIFIMGPIFNEINDQAIKPFTTGQISAEAAIGNGMKPLRAFMLNQVEEKDVALFVELSGEMPEVAEDIPNRVLIPAFLLGELTKGFKIGVFIYLPFIVIDMVVASVLMAMGMMMLPPVMISMPFKIMLFVMCGGWSFLLESLVRTFKF